MIISLLRYLKQTPEPIKSLILYSLDLIISLLIVFSVGYFSSTYDYLSIYLIFCFLLSGVYIFTGLYSVRSQFVTFYFVKKLFIVNLLCNFILYLILYFQNLSVNLFVLTTIFFYIVTFHLAYRYFLRDYIKDKNKEFQKKLVICGDLDQTVNLLNYFYFREHYSVIGIMLENAIKSKKVFSGVDILDFELLSQKCSNGQVDLLIICGDWGKRHQKRLSEIILKYGTKVKYIESVEFFLDKTRTDYLDNLPIEILLGRQQVDKNTDLLKGPICNKTVMVTGAGGSIGSELAKQVLMERPSNLILLDASEKSIYDLQELLAVDNSLTKIHYVVGNILDQYLLDRLANQFSISTIYHAAAYKHVHIVEDNVHSAVLNNVIGTWNLCLICEKLDVQDFVLISTDKAVRPTNFMGASKRLCELVCLGFSSKIKTKFTIVRFGNVLGSSGSVIPKFLKLISEGKNIPVTHPEINRYFMSTQEAVGLVMQAAGMDLGSSIFVLDMGKPVKIVDLAKALIKLAGKTPVLRSKCSNPGKSDICIEFTGLRPGEKLYEELLIDGSVSDTNHTKISKVNDKGLHFSEIKVIVDDLKEKLKFSEPDNLKEFLKTLPVNFQSNQEFGVDTSPFNGKSLMEDSSLKRSVRTSYNHQRAEKTSILQILNLPLVNGFLLRILKAYFLIVRPMTLGVRVCLINEEDQVLLVKHTYLPGWFLPGGGVERGESLYDAAIRELSEETGLVTPIDLEPVKIFQNTAHSKGDHVQLFMGSISDTTNTYKKNLEISQAKFFDLDSIPEDINPFSYSLIQIAYQKRTNSVVTSSNRKMQNSI